MDAFDADALIYASVPSHPLGERVAAILPAQPADGDPAAGIGSLLLLPEVLAKPLRDRDETEVASLLTLLTLLDLHPVDRSIAQQAATLAAKYRLKAADATHLATAVALGADRFITNNRKDFPQSITEVDVVYPADLPEV
jgi:predicted nucleic acid-binding protein